MDIEITVINNYTIRLWIIIGDGPKGGKGILCLHPFTVWQSDGCIAARLPCKCRTGNTEHGVKPHKTVKHQLNTFGRPHVAYMEEPPLRTLGKILFIRKNRCVAPHVSSNKLGTHPALNRIISELLRSFDPDITTDSKYLSGSEELLLNIRHDKFFRKEW